MENINNIMGTATCENCFSNKNIEENLSRDFIYTPKTLYKNDNSSLNLQNNYSIEDNSPNYFLYSSKVQNRYDKKKKSNFEDLKSNINLKDIKSTFIIKNIFSFLNENQKLNMIIYNKELQKRLSINIEHIKEISGRYKKVEKNRKGKEYKLNTDIVLFDGEYLNGKRNGKGKEYNNFGVLIFEGEYLNGDGQYLNGKRNGKGKEYYDNVTLKFDGEYLNDKRNGKGKEYYYNGKLYFEGEYLEGKKWNEKGYDIKGNLEYEIKNGKGKIKEYFIMMVN